MKSSGQYVGFTSEINSGKLAYFILFDKKGIETDIEELVNTALNFDTVVLCGDEPFLQKSDLRKMTERIIRQKSDITIIVHTNGTIKPTLPKYIDKFIFNVKLQLKTSGVDYDTRIKSSVIGWFSEADSVFCFDVSGQDDIDEVNMIIKDIGMLKHQVYLGVSGDTQDQLDKTPWLLTQCKLYGYNYNCKLGHYYDLT